MVGQGFGHCRAWFRVPQTIQVLLHGVFGKGGSPKDVAQHLVGSMGEDGAVYKALEFAGPFIEALSIEDRMLFPLMAIDLGAKTGFINPDEKMTAYARAHSSFKKFDLFQNDPNVTYENEVEIDVSKIGPQVACPPTIGNVKPVEDVAGIPINIAEVGGSTGGRLEDLRVLEKWLKGKKVHQSVRMQIVPATRGIYPVDQLLHSSPARQRTAESKTPSGALAHLLSPAQECTKSAGDLTAGYQYKVTPENNLYNEGITFVRLWPRPDEQSGQPLKKHCGEKNFWLDPATNAP